MSETVPTGGMEVATDLPTFASVDGHYNAAPFYLTPEMFGGVPMTIAGGKIDHLVGKPVADLHTHEVREIYFLISPNSGGARIAVTVDDQTRELFSPALIHVPAGSRHRFVTLAAETGSYCFGILLADPYA